MTRTQSLAITLSLLAIGAAAGGCRRAPADSRPTTGSGSPLPTAPTLALKELFRPGGDALVPSDKTTKLAGQRVRMTGFMAHMEIPPKGAFFLVPYPVHCDEAGGGTADLPPESVLVISESARGREIPWMRGPLEMTGILEVGNRADEDGRVSAFRLFLDGPLETQVALTHNVASGAPSAPRATGRTDAP